MRPHAICSDAFVGPALILKRGGVHERMHVDETGVCVIAARAGHFTCLIARLPTLAARCNYIGILALQIINQPGDLHDAPRVQQPAKRNRAALHFMYLR